MQIKHRVNLIDLIKFYNLQDLPCAEIGVAEGYFSHDMLNWGIPKLYMVDNWGHIKNVTGDGNFDDTWHNKNYTAAVERVKKFGEKAVILRGLSVDMAAQIPDKSLGLVYLDANHSYEGVTADLNAWIDKVVDGGIIAGHDYLSPQYGVYKAVQDFCKGKYGVHIIPEIKQEDAGFYFIKK